MHRYRILRPLGVGGAGRVVLVEDRLRPGSRLALKELLDAGPEKTQELHREFATLATLRHPSLVEVHELEVDSETGRSQLVMEYVDGDHIVATIRAEGPESLPPLAAEILRSLAFLHDFGLVHRDLKPGNILVRRLPKAGHRVVVLDFGLAAQRSEETSPRAAGMAGTLPYMAPELFEGSAPTKRTDLYALAAVLYEAVHGKTPFTLKGNDVNGFIAGVREGRRARPPSPAGFPAGLARWLDEILGPDPSDRPSSATDALARLNEACGTDFALETTDDRAARLGSGEPVGRGVELAALRREIAPSDAPRIAWLCGDAGAGKTRLLRFLGGEAIGKGWRVHAPPGALPGSADEFVDRVRSDAATAPTLVLFDELERADNAIATFVDRIAREPRMPPVHVVAALRSGEVTHPRLRKLLADTGVVPSLARIDLAPMGEPGLKSLIERATAGRSSAQARVKWLLDASEGNAGAAEALLVAGVWEKHGKVPVAVALEQSIRRRLDALSPEGRAWLEALATLGDDAPDTLVGELAGLEEGAGAAAEEAVAAGLARRATATSFSPDSRRTTDAVKAAASPERLTQLHALAATHYAAQERDTFGATTWRLARLWRGAGEFERALAAALDAASAAEVAKNWEEAAERIRFALTLLPRRDRRRGELWMRGAESLRQATLHRDAIKAFGWAARWATDPERKLEAQARQAKALFMAGRPLMAETLAERLIAAAQTHGSTLNEGRAWEVVVAVRLQRFEFQGALEPALSAYRLLAPAASEDTAAALHGLIAVEARLRIGQPDAHFEEALKLCDAGDLRYQRVMLLLSRALLAERAGELDRMAWAIEAAEQVAGGERTAIWLRWLQQLRSRSFLLRGSYDRAADAARAAAELALYSNEPGVWSTAVSHVAEAMTDSGRTTEARNFLLAELSSPMPGIQAVGNAVLRLALARCSEASELDPEVSAVLATLRSSTRLFRANALAFELSEAIGGRAGREATTIFAEAEAILLDSGDPVPTVARVALLLAMARYLVANGDFGKARELLRNETPPVDCPVDPSRFGQTRFLLAECETSLGLPADSAQSRSLGAALIELAADRIADPDWRRDFLGQPLIRNLIMTIPKPSEGRRLEALYEMIRALNSETDPEALLGSILEMAMKAVEAERGMILLSGPTGTDFSVRLAKNLEKETQIDAEAVSRRIVSAAEQGESILALDAGQDDRFKDFKSVSLFRIRSLMCVPLRSRGKIVGTVYLDSRRQGKLFSRDDLRFVEAFADHAALALENARKRVELENENRRLKAVVGERSSYAQIIGRSPAMQKIFDLLERIAPSDATVLIQGESGTGKELVARALHFNGPRKDKVFLSENCAAIAETLLESELFGHVRGAFTGAERDREGVFEQAHGGTLFLDEIGDMSQAMQARLLRVLQEGELRRVGGEHPIRVDVRLIAATNKDLQAAVAASRFREDLYYRLAVVPVQLPPLRERIGDVPFIAGHLLAQITAARGRGTPRIESDVLDALERYPWPGNVRQLENLLRRLALLAGDGAIDRSVIESDADLAKMFLGKQEAFVPVMSMEKSELEQIRRALEAAAGNRDRAARLLGISRATIYRKMREHGLR